MVHGSQHTRYMSVCGFPPVQVLVRSGPVRVQRRVSVRSVREARVLGVGVSEAPHGSRTGSQSTGVPVPSRSGSVWTQDGFNPV